MKTAFVFIFLCIPSFVFPQSKEEGFNRRPKLVVGVVVDQMRQEYLYRYYQKFGDGGFKRLVGDGFMLENAHYNYVPTYTGPGHTSIYTGSTPAIHGIIGNDWYDKGIKKNVNCVEDPNQKPVGVAEGNGDVSPWRMLTSTITDELKLATQQKAKVIGISIKDRAAVLPAGHMPNGAYWYDGGSGGFMTSTYYMEKLPSWLTGFNARRLADSYLNQEWKTLLPIKEYTESGPDDSAYEEPMKGKEKPVFPYDLKTLRAQNGNFALLPMTPFGNDILGELAKAAIDGESLGKDDVTDFLAVSFSTPDIIGHSFGPYSIEEEDVYLRLDRTIADLFAYLDKVVGSNQYTVFLTADHGVADGSQLLMDDKIPAGYFRPDMAAFNSYMAKAFPGKDLIEAVSNNQIYLNQNAFQGDPKSSGVDFLVATETIANYLKSLEGVAEVYTTGNLKQGAYDERTLRGFVIRGHNANRSGDIAWINQPGWTSMPTSKGTTHGSPYSYDTHVPVLFYGMGIKHGTSATQHDITDIAPTLSVLLKIKFPNGCTGQPIGEILNDR